MGKTIALFDVDGTLTIPRKVKARCFDDLSNALASELSPLTIGYFCSAERGSDYTRLFTRTAEGVHAPSALWGRGGGFLLLLIR